MVTEEHDEKLNMCFVAHYAYGSISGHKGGHVGGIERQIDLMAKWLAGKGHKISVITWNEGPEQDEVHEGVRIIKLCKMNEGIRGLRYIHPRLTSLISAMKRANADIYYQNGSEDITGQVALWCKLNKRKFVFSSASDVDCEKDLPELRHLHERLLYRLGIRLASGNITQTIKQKTLFNDNFGLESKQLPMPCEGPREDELNYRKYPTHIDVLWIGRINKDKRLEIFLNIAKKFSGCKFHVAGKPNDTDYPVRMLEEMKEISNVTYHGALEREQLKRLYNDAFLLCNTSKYEGFPNTFLEAWSYGTPVLTTVDPDDIITKNKLGYKLDGIDGFYEKIKELLENKNEWEELSLNSRKYYLETHQVDCVMDLYESMFYAVAAK